MSPSIDYVYFLRCQGFVKIGRTCAPTLREKEIQANNPFPLELLGFFVGSHSDERRLHQRFAADRVNGEWFKLTPELERIARTSVAVCTIPIASVSNREAPPAVCFVARSRSMVPTGAGSTFSQIGSGQGVQSQSENAVAGRECFPHQGLTLPPAPFGGCS